MYLFRSIKDDDAIVSYISSTYKKERITNYAGLKTEMDVIINDVSFRNGVVVWRLTDQIFLALTKRDINPDGAATYLLTVWNSQLDQKNKIAWEEINKKRVPVPKF